MKNPQTQVFNSTIPINPVQLFIMQTITKEIYKTDDGKVFESKKEAENYERKLKEEEAKTSYWKITYKPDLTEGRGYYGGIYVKIVGGKQTYHNLYLETYCFEKIGGKVALVQGCSAMPNWSIREINVDSFNQKRKHSVGDYSYEPETLEFEVEWKKETLTEIKS